MRAYKAVGREPIIIRRGQGAYVWDVDGNVYIDYVESYGPLILGHAPPEVIAAIHETAVNGTSFGMPTEAEAELAQLIVNAVDSIELVRFVNSGTEATMSAIRLARAATSRQKVIKFAGCYHGHCDALLVEAGSGATTLGIPSSAGVPLATAEQTIVLPYNDLNAVAEAFYKHPRTIAAVMVEPIAGNMGCVLPKAGYLQGLRELCDERDALLIFDEVMTGFRVGWGAAQGLYGVKPDLTCLGKIIGSGLPCAAYGGREELMRMVAPDGPVYQAGTLSGNPLAMAAGIATLTTLKNSDAYSKLERVSEQLAMGLRLAANEAGVAVLVTRVGSMICCFFTGGKVENYEDALKCDTGAFATFFGSMLDQGVVLPPSQFETWFVSTAHDGACIERTVQAARGAFNAVAERLSDAK